MKASVAIGDYSGCWKYRVDIPFKELKKFNVETKLFSELPNNPWGDSFLEICRMIYDQDILFVQRCYKYELLLTLRRACDITGTKLIFDTDDDYLHIPVRNPCFPELAAPGVLPGYIEILKMADLVTVSTKELGRTLHPYNKNIVIMQNNVEHVHWQRSYYPEEIDPNTPGSIKKPNNVMGLVTIPSFFGVQHKDKVDYKRVLRVGYTGTPTHQEDFETIHFQWEKFLSKVADKIWVVYIGDPYFYQKTLKGWKRMFHIPITPYEIYLQNIRNLDVGMAPLMPNIFNMSKSDIKAVEYASWGIPAVLPNYVTYNRTFKHGETCLFYNNSNEYVEAMAEILNNHKLRETLGNNARQYVADNRLESQPHNAERRFTVYDKLVKGESLAEFIEI